MSGQICYPGNLLFSQKVTDLKKKIAENLLLISDLKSKHW